LGLPQQKSCTTSWDINAKDKELKGKESVLLAAHIVRMIWCVTDKREYLPRRREVGKVIHALVGSYDAAMRAVQAAALVEDRAKVEIEVTAVVLQ